MHYDCLIVDDETELAQSTGEYFNLFEVKTYVAASASECKDFLVENSCDLILLDINLSDGSGFELCKHIRNGINVPILFISARTSDDDILIALNVGGDDYIKKPYSLNVLLAKVKTVFKRYKGTTAADEKYVFDNGRIEADLKSGSIYVEGIPIQLKAMEYRLFEYLIRNKDRVISKEELFSKVWGDSFTGDGTLNVHIRHIREKIERDPANAVMIRTLWGRGYIFSPDGDSKETER